MSLFNKAFDDEEYSPDNNSIAPPKPLILRIIGGTFKFAFWALIIFINAILLWRVFSSGDPASMKTVIGNESLKNAYEAWINDKSDDKEDFAIFQHANSTITDEDGDEESGTLGNYGYFSLTDVTVFPTASQVQIVFRYNDSTLEALAEDYGLDSVPNKKELWYEVTAKVTYTDGSTKRFYCDSPKTAWKTLYTYARMTFTDLGNFEGIDTIDIEIYYKNDINYAAEPYGSLCVYNSSYKNAEYKLDRKDIKAIKKGAD